jgi:hypothetical protein
MRVLISAEGNHEPAGHHLIVVDGKATLVDLSGVTGSLHDPSIARVEWGTVQDGNEIKPGGTIVRTDGSRRPFFDRSALMPYLNAFNDQIAARAAAGEAK